MSNILQNLLTSDDRGEFVPQLAVAVPSGPDVREGPLRVTFRLDPKAAPIEDVPICVLTHVSINFVVKVSYASKPVLLTIQK